MNVRDLLISAGCWDLGVTLRPDIAGDREGTVRPEPRVVELCPDDRNHVMVGAILKDLTPDAWGEAVRGLAAAFRAAAAERGGVRWRPLPSLDGAPVDYVAVDVDGIPARLVACYVAQHQGWHVSIDAWHEAKDPGPAYSQPRGRSRWDLVNELETVREREASAQEAAKRLRADLEDTRKGRDYSSRLAADLQSKLAAAEKRAAEAEKGQATLSASIGVATARKAEQLARPLRDEIRRLKDAHADVAGTLAKLDAVRDAIKRHRARIKSDALFDLMEAAR